MAIAVVGTPFTTATGITTQDTSSVDAGTGSDRALYSTPNTHSGIQNRSITGVTYAGVNGVEVFNGSPTGSGADIDEHSIWRWTDPATGANDLVTSQSGSQSRFGITALCFSGVDQADPEDTGAQATGSDAEPVITLAHGGGDDVILNGVVADDNPGLTVDAPNTSEAETEDAQMNVGIGWSGSADPAWTLGAAKSWSLIAINVNAAGAGGAVISPYYYLRRRRVA